MNIKKIIVIIFLYISLINYVFSAIYISEIMPNTIDDVNLEYIELTNSWNNIEYLNSYILKDKSQKEFIFWTWDFIESNQKIKFYRPQTKILLNNTKEELYLFNDLWKIIDKLIYEKSVKWEKIINNHYIIFYI